MRETLIIITVVVVTTVVTAAVTAWYLIGGPPPSIKLPQSLSAVGRLEKDMHVIYMQVVQDAIGQYNIVSKHGSSVDQCVHAGLVAAAYVQAKDEANYKEWKAIETINCRLSALEFETEFEKKMMGIK